MYLSKDLEKLICPGKLPPSPTQTVNPLELRIFPLSIDWVLISIALSLASWLEFVTEFIQGQGKSFSAINKIKELGDALKIKQEELAEEGKQISDYQGSKGILGLGLVTAAGNDSIEVFEDENGEFGISYLSPVTGEPIKLSEADISDPKLYSINEKFDTSVVAETLKDDLKSHLTKQYDVSEYDIKSGGVAKVKTQVWDKPELKTKG